MAVAMDSLVLVLEELLFNATLRLTQGFKCAFNVILDTILNHSHSVWT